MWAFIQIEEVFRLISLPMLEALKTLLEQKRYSEALFLSGSLEKSQASQALFHLYRGVAALELRQLDFAGICFSKAIELDEKLVASYKNLALVYYLKKDPRAFSQLLLSNWLDPLDPQTYSLLLKNHSPVYPDADVVFYTASPYWNLDISPEALQKKGLGGSETAFVQMAQELSRLGKRVVCFCSVPERKIYDAVEYIPVVEFFLFNHLKRVKNFVSSRFAYPFQVKVNAEKTFLWLHDMDGVVDETSPFDWGRIDHCLALSDYQIDHLVRQKNYPKEKFLKVKNGFFADLFVAPSSETTRIRHSLIYFSRPSRGLAQAIEVLRSLRQKNPDAQLYVCSYTVKENIQDDPDMQYLMSLKNEPGVKVLGSLNKSELAQLLMQMELCLYPNTSHLETFCIVAIEAMAAGVPVISSDRGALPETVCEGEGGKIIPYTEDHLLIERLAEECLALLQDKQE